MALPGSSRSMNQSRSCAKDSGSAPVRSTGTTGGSTGSSARRISSTRPASSATVGPSKSARSGSSTPNTCADPRDHARGQQRVPAQLEEALLHPHPLQPQHLRPDPRQHLLRRRPRRHVPRPPPARTPAPAAPCGPACRSASAAAPPARRTPPAPCTPAGCRRRCSRSSRPPPPLAAPRTPPAACRPARPRAPPPRASRTSGCSATARPRSPPARCGSRGPSPARPARPRNSSSPSASHRTRSPVRYSRAPGSRRTGRGRTAPPSAPAGPGSRAPPPSPPTYSSPGTPDRRRLQAPRPARRRRVFAIGAADAGSTRPLRGSPASARALTTVRLGRPVVVDERAPGQPARTSADQLATRSASPPQRSPQPRSAGRSRSARQHRPASAGRAGQDA